MRLVFFVALTLAVGGCSRWDIPPVPVNTAYILDGTSPSPSPRKERVRRPPNMANASMDTTGSVNKSGPFNEDEVLSKIILLKPSSPEWFALKKEMEEGRKAENKRELDRITICRC